MEMEHINENTIRVLIKSEDLAARGITFLDLLGNHNEIENFFYSILEEVDIDEEFKGSEAVTFQVLPKGDGLELLISKSLPSEDLSEFDELPNSEEGISDMLKKHVATQLQEPDAETPEVTSSFVFELPGFEQMIQLAAGVYLDSAITNLYQMNGVFFLEVQFPEDEVSESDLENALSLILEFAGKSSVTAEVLDEYGQLIMEHDALELTRFYFNS